MPKKTALAIGKKIKSIKLLVMDCDGVLTDGRITYGSGGLEIKAFNVKDGHGIKLLRMAGLKSAVITTRSSEALERRAKELGIDHVYQGRSDKLTVFAEILKKEGLTSDEAAYIGDDVVDLPAMLSSGFPVAVADAVAEVKKIAFYETKLCGGQGAVREAIEIILKKQGLWSGLMKRYGV
ncbi:MAG: HAD hydrolase family protein [Deltaproteobacteria bacterium]|nr:HAD hydrolase family protein [Deltaproteobacteria bacterium]